ncbi:MAG: hypothetical protein ABFS42_08490 [Candidatus Krumholzibacteriota bacterium]
MGPLAWLTTALLEVVYPERCFLCGAMRGETSWETCGCRVAGLRFWDEAHLCRSCSGTLVAETVTGVVGQGHAGCLKVAAASATHADLVKLVGGFKYHGLRGLAWPLARRLRNPLVRAQGSVGHVDALVPVPLHARRRRVRGFNQAEILARLVGAESDLPVLADVLVRRRNTGQQARIGSVAKRRRNLTNCYRAGPPVETRGDRGRGFRRIGLVDDLVTSGWTAVAAAATLRASGWEVAWVLTLGLAAKARNPTSNIDTWVDGF